MKLYRSPDSVVAANYKNWSRAGTGMNDDEVSWVCWVGGNGIGDGTLAAKSRLQVIGFDPASTLGE